MLKSQNECKELLKCSIQFMGREIGWISSLNSLRSSSTISQGQDSPTEVTLVLWKRGPLCGRIFLRDSLLRVREAKKAATLLDR